MESKWIWETPGWTEKYKPDGIAVMRAKNIEGMELSSVRILTREDMEQLVAQAMEKEVSASSAIEGIRLDSSRIRSSIINNLGIPTMAWIPPWNRNSREEAAVSASISLLRNNGPLSVEMLEGIHGMLDSGPHFGHLRDSPEIVTDGKRTIYECPPADEARRLTEGFCKWWNDGRARLPSPLAAAVAHLNFVAIHPFADGNGRMARMLADKALSLGISPLRPYSLAQAIKRYPGPYYNSLENVTGHNGDPAQFVNYILDIHEEEVRKFQARALIMSRINRIPDLLPLEREILREISKSPERRWGKYEAGGSLDVSPEEIGMAWERLERMGLIENGMPRLQDCVPKMPVMKEPEEREEDCGEKFRPGMLP